MKAIDKDMLYRLYLASLEEDEPDIPQLDLPDGDWINGETFSFDEPEEGIKGNIGQILVIVSGRQEILCLITDKNKEGLFLAYKLSNFTGLGSENDFVFVSGSSRYLLERDNYFWLNEEAIEGGYIIEAVSHDLLKMVEAKLNEESKLLAKLDNAWDSPENRFRRKEHELTLELRSRHLSDRGLWIPQLELVNREDFPEKLPFAAATEYAPMYNFIKFQVDVNVYFSEYYTLKRNECYDLVLVPDDKHVGKVAEIRCGEIAVFRGELPEEIVMARFIPLKPQQAQQYLDIKLILLKDLRDAKF